MNFRFHQCQGVPLNTIVNTISADGLKMMSDFMLWNPEKRPTATNASFKLIIYCIYTKLCAHKSLSSFSFFKFLALKLSIKYTEDILGVEVQIFPSEPKARRSGDEPAGADGDA